MSVASFLNTDAQYARLLAQTDVSTVMTAIATMLTATLSNTPTAVFTTTQRWTNTSGTTYQSPADARGRYMKVTLTRTAATRLRFTIEDPSGTLFDGEIQIAGGGSTVDVYAGPGHFYVEANNAGTWEMARAVITDPTPEALDSGPSYVWCSTYRNAAGSTIANAALLNQWSGRYSGGSQIGTSSVQEMGARPIMLANDSNWHLQTEAGSDVVAPLGISNCVSAATLSGAALYAGKLYQVICVTQGQTPGAILPVPIDTGVTGNFKVTNVTISGGNRMAIRIP